MTDLFRLYLARYGLSILQGTTFDVWWNLLRLHRFRISPSYWPRASLLTMCSLANSAIARRESEKFEHSIDSVDIPHPIFILGHFRSGTTHLHNMLSLDPQFICPTLFQAIFPLTYSSTQGALSRIASLLIRNTRPQDHVAVGIGTPAEDEFALCAMTGLSPYLGWVFPMDRLRYSCYIDFKGAPEEEKERWKGAMSRFVRKVASQSGRRPLLKSPFHTARIRLLLELFPDARFIHICRNPFDVFKSTRHMWVSGNSHWRMQEDPISNIDDVIIDQYKVIYRGFFEDMDLVKPGRLFQLSYEDLARDPELWIEEIYLTLGLSRSDDCRDRLKRYLLSLDGYRKTDHHDITHHIREKITREWKQFYEKWGYA